MNTTSARLGGNRAVVGQQLGRRPGSRLISSFFRHSSFVIPLLLLLILRDITNESTAPSASFLYSVRAFQTVALAHNNICQSWHRPPSTANFCGHAILRATSSSNNSADKDNNNNNNNQNQNQNRIRLNKVFKKTHSRRAADRLIEEGRVSINGEKVATKGGFFVVPYVDEVSLDGSVVEGWEEMNYVAASDGNTKAKGNQSNNQAPKLETKNDKDYETKKESGRRNSNFEYIKYWKPRGVICTTDPNIPGNIIDEIRVHDGYDPPHRVYPVGRLDKETTGIILLTSDGRLPNAALRKQHKRPKIYEVLLDPPLGAPGNYRATRVLEQLSEGVVISTETVRNGIRKTLTAPTEPCQVEQLDERWIKITLKEGRNRQVRKMTKAVGHTTVELERVSFAGIPLEPGLRGPGDWDYLEGDELEIVTDMIRIAAEAAAEEEDGSDAYWENSTE